jgi:hypothetical protein
MLCEDYLLKNDLESFMRKHEYPKIVNCGCRGLTIRLAIEKNMIEFVRYMIDNEFVCVTSSNSLLIYTAHAYTHRNHQIFNHFHDYMKSRFGDYIFSENILINAIYHSKEKDRVENAQNIGYKMEKILYTLAKVNLVDCIDLIEKDIITYDRYKLYMTLNDIDIDMDNKLIRKFLFSFDKENYSLHNYCNLANKIIQKKRELNVYKNFLYDHPKIPNDLGNMIYTYL